MKSIFAIAACAFTLPGVALAATRTYEMSPFEGISIAAGVDARVTVGPTQSIVAETWSNNFEDLRIAVEDHVLRIDRSPRSWFSNLFFGNGYTVHVVMPALHSLTASSGSDVSVKGNLEGDLSITASSGSDIDVAQIKGGDVKVNASSGSDLDISGSCVSLDAHLSSGSDLRAKNLKCENVTLQTSSGSDVSVHATKRVVGKASSGSDVLVRGKPALVQVETSSGADVVRE
jgi:hypothetical protein